MPVDLEDVEIELVFPDESRELARLTVDKNTTAASLSAYVWMTKGLNWRICV